MPRTYATINLPVADDGSCPAHDRICQLAALLAVERGSGRLTNAEAVDAAVSAMLAQVKQRVQVTNG